MKIICKLPAARLFPRFFPVSLLAAIVLLVGIQKSPAPVSDTLAISASPTNGAAPLTVTFTAGTTSSTGFPVTSWNWTFSTNTTPQIGTASGRVVNFTFTNAGTYSAIISYSPHGAPGIGNPATLYITVTNPPPPVSLMNPQIQGSSFVFSFQTASNQSYTVQSSTNLLFTNWLYVTNFTGNGNITNISEPLGTNLQFFRVRKP